MKNYTKDIVVFNNTIAPYRVSLYKEMSSILANDQRKFKVVFLSESETVREWSVDVESLDFDYEVLPIIYQKRALSTTTSDFIINIGYFKYILSDTVLIYGYSYPTFIILALLRKIFGKRTILFCESTLLDKSVSSILKKKLKTNIVRRLFDTYLVPGIESKKFLEFYGAERSRIHIAENAVDTFERKDHRNIEASSTTIKLLYVGRLAAEKNIDFLIENIPNDESFVYELVIVGSGPEEAYLKGLDKKCKVTFTGFLEGNDLRDVFHSSDVFVLPSRSEPWGLVVNEALSLGLAVLVSDHVGCRHELVTDNGYIFELDDPADFKDKLKKLSSNLQIMKANSLKLSERVTIESQAKKICRVLEKC
ncbi:glycosyltransferase family 4 protein [Vibrio mediterranei]|uniref:glycosyltransferase family 4 protein n=1 Tax=Vibrio mediterranei TaxID=689 RepID=UPI0040687884